VTSDDYMGLGPHMLMWEISCILFGCSVPIFLRKQNGFYTILGECFVLGFMDGEIIEVIEKGKYGLQELEIH